MSAGSGRGTRRAGCHEQYALREARHDLDGTLKGHIYFHLGDDSGFRAERFNESRPVSGPVEAAMEETLRCRRTLRGTARVVGNGQEPAVVFAVGDALGDALVVSEPIEYSGGTGELDLMRI